MVLATHSHTLVHVYTHVRACTRIYIYIPGYTRTCTYPPPLSLSVALCGATLYRGWENGWRRHICGSVGSEGNHEWRERQPVDKRGKARRGLARGAQGRKGVYADIRVSPVTAILRKTFDLFAHAVANPEERLIPTRMLGMPRLFSPAASLSILVLCRVSVRDRQLFGTRRTGSLSAPRLAKIRARSRSTANYS